MKGFVLLGLHGSVDGEGMECVHGCVVDGANDPCRADDVPGCGGIGFAVSIEEVFLRVIEIGFEGDTGVGFDVGSAGAAEVDAVVFGACLQ